MESYILTGNFQGSAPGLFPKCHATMVNLTNKAHLQSCKYSLSHLSLVTWAFTPAVHLPAGLCLWNCTRLSSSLEFSTWAAGERHSRTHTVGIITLRWVIFTLDFWGHIIFTTIFILYIWDPIITAFVLLQTLGSYISLQLDCTDISEVESKENLPGTNIQHVVFFTEVESGIVEDPTDWKTSGCPLLRIWTETHTNRQRVQLMIFFFFYYVEYEEDTIQDIMTDKDTDDKKNAKGHLTMQIKGCWGRFKFGHKMWYTPQILQVFFKYTGTTQHSWKASLSCPVSHDNYTAQKPSINCLKWHIIYLCRNLFLSIFLVYLPLFDILCLSVL